MRDTLRHSYRLWALIAALGLAFPAAAQDADDASPPSQQPVPEGSSEQQDAPAEDQPDADQPEAEDKPADETPKETGPVKVEWDDKIAAVAEKSYPENADDLRTLQTQVQRVIASAMPQTVAIQIGGASGSGVIVGADGLVLTAGHVCGQPGRKAVFIFPDGRRVRGETLGVNREIDSGMARITEPGPWPYCKMAAAADIKAGQWVVALGQPGGFDGERSPPVRLGRVLFANDRVVNTDCTLVGGDSGGPLFNLRGEVVGIHSRIGPQITNNFHVPISTYHTTRDRLLAGEMWGGRMNASEPVRARALLGVAGNSLEGKAEITQVYPGMPAALAGLQVGDVVLKFNDDNVASFDELATRVLKSRPGARVKLVVQRGEANVDIEVRLGQTMQRLPGSPDVEPPDEDE